MKKRIIIITSIIVIILMIVSLAVMYHQREMKRQEEIQIDIMKTKNELYIYLLGIDGEFSYEPNRVIVEEMYIDNVYLIKYVALYNEFCEDKKVTVEQVLEGYEDFCNGEGESEALNAVIDFDLGEHYLPLGYRYSEYSGKVGIYVGEKFGLDSSYEATPEQVQEAAEYVAKQIHEEIESMRRY